MQLLCSLKYLNHAHCCIYPLHVTFKVVLALLQTDDHEVAHNVPAYSINFGSQSYQQIQSL